MCDPEWNSNTYEPQLCVSKMRVFNLHGSLKGLSEFTCLAQVGTYRMLNQYDFLPFPSMGGCDKVFFLNQQAHTVSTVFKNNV